MRVHFPAAVLLFVLMMDGRKHSILAGKTVNLAQRYEKIDERRKSML